MNRNNFFKRLHGKCDGKIELRAILKDKVRDRTFVALSSDWQSVTQEIDKLRKKNEGCNLFFGIATRDGNGGKEGNVISIPCVYVEMDMKNFPEEEIWKKLKKFRFKPTIIVKSGEGVHIYFMLNQPVGLESRDKIVAINQAIAFGLGGGKLDNVSDIPRIFRIPDTFNHKYPEKPLCKVLETNDCSYTVDELITGLNISENDIKAIAEKDITLQKGLENYDESEGTTNRFKDFLQKTDPASEGNGGDNKTFQVACKGRDFGLSPEVTLDLMLGHWNKRCEPPWDTKELMVKVKNAYNYAKNPLGCDNPINDFKDLPENNNPPNGIPIIHIADVKCVPVEFQIDKIWPVNSVGFMSGQPGICKSWLAWEIAVSIASGTKLFGLYECRKGKVLAFNAEDDPAMVTRSRIAAFARQKKLAIEGLDLHLINVAAITLNDDDVQEQLEITIEQHKPDMLILDPFRNVHSLDEDSATDMSKLLHFLREINRKHSCSILLVCHDKKPGIGNGKDRGAQVRGTSALVGWRDNAIFMDKKEELTKVQIYNRSCQPISPFNFILKTGTDSHGNLETAGLVVTTHELVEDQKKLKELHTIKEIIREYSPIAKNEIIEKAKKNRKNCLDLINYLIESDNDVTSQDGLIMINNKGENYIDNQVPERRNLTEIS